MNAHVSRRTVLQAGGLFAVPALASVGRAGKGKTQDPRDLRVFADHDTGGATEAVTQQNTAYVATGDELVVIDWRNPGRPETIAEVDVPGEAVEDVKVDGELLAISSQAANDPADIGTHFYDVSDPANPAFQGTWQELPAGIHNHFLDGDTAYLCREAPFDDSALRILDVSDPTDPTEVAEWTIEDNVDSAFDRPVNFLHDVYVQNGLAYLAYWDAGVVVLDVNDPGDPEFLAQFGAATDATDPVTGTFTDPMSDFAKRILLPPGNAHYVQPSASGDLVFVGAETFPFNLIGQVEGATRDDYGGIKVFDTSDLTDPELLTRIDPPVIDDDVSGKFFTAHNFDVTPNRLHTSWYNGGVHLFDITDPANPGRLAAYDPDGSQFWTAVHGRSVTVGSDRGSGGLVFLHDDRGEKRPPGFDHDAEPLRGPLPPGSRED